MSIDIPHTHQQGHDQGRVRVPVLVPVLVLVIVDVNEGMEEPTDPVINFIFF